ncbi:hypothetical protein QFC20_005005 [Naganishia adeliensis]|uniref:Uncharacterized protein n=1 Tax=Naganishia adeliensis TaxID=92952 RepID=A0ACC2VTU0_9TREE|nr:hypothetical protein QFC20_005005 [Naganishia adeliensis]
MSPTTQDVPTDYVSAAERRIWLLSAVIVIMSTEAQHLTSTAITAAFLKIWYPGWPVSEEEKLKVLERRRSGGGGDQDRSKEAREVALNSTIAHGEQEDGRGAYFTQVPVRKGERSRLM